MKAAIYTRYGDADVVKLADLPVPAPGPKEVLIRTDASSVTTADWRLRASAFPGLLWLPGRLMTGLFGPRAPVLGMEIAGTVVACGADVQAFTVGQRVFGFSGGNGHAEYIALPEDAPILPIPQGLSAAEAVSVPWGGLSALVFLRDVAKLRAGQDILIVGASGGVGLPAVQIAKAMGARVTAVASASRADLLRRLGADRVIDYRAEHPASARQAYDVVLDTVGTTNLRQMAPTLRRGGVFVPLNFGGREIRQALMDKLTGRRRIALAVSEDHKEDLQILCDMLRDGALTPVIDSRYPLDRIRDAYAKVETRHRAGAVIIDVIPPEAARLSA